MSDIGTVSALSLTMQTNTFTNSQGLTVTVDGDYLVVERDGAMRIEFWPELGDMLTRLAALVSQ